MPPRVRENRSVKEVADAQTTVQKEGGKKGGMFSLEDQFAFYGQYHVNPTNVAIHMIFVPTLLWSFMVFLGFHVPQNWSLGKTDIFGLEIDWRPGFIYGFMHMIYFPMLDPIAGLLYAPFCFAMAYSSNWLPLHLPEAYYVAHFFWWVGWFAQFYGHGVHEGRAPALLQNLFQSVVLANFFVHMEWLFKLGYRPKLHKRLQNRIGKEVAAYRKEKAAASRAKGK